MLSREIDHLDNVSFIDKAKKLFEISNDERKCIHIKKISLKIILIFDVTMIFISINNQK